VAIGTLTTLWVLQPPAAEAANLSVNDTSDSLVAGDGKCTLREAIINANSDTDTTAGDCAAGSGADTITVPAGTYTLTFGSELVIQTDLTLNGAGANSTIIEAATDPGVANFRVFFINGGNIAISGLTIRHGGGGAVNGGGIAKDSGTLTLSNSIVSDNVGKLEGGGIRNRDALTLINSIVRNNGVGAPGEGGGIWNDGIVSLVNSVVSGNTSGAVGGGITNRGGTVLIMDSIINDNTAAWGGGGIQNRNPFGGGQVTLTNSTISGNTALGDGLPSLIGGGGIWNEDLIILSNMTVSNNEANPNGGGIRNFSGTVEARNSIIARNIASTGSDCSGDPVTSAGHNLDSDGTYNLTEPTDLPSTDPLLGPLQDNGGPTETHALLPGSPAIDHIPLANCTDADDTPITTDQRGVARPQEDSCDIGAYEAREDEDDEDDEDEEEDEEEDGTATFTVNSSDDVDDGTCNAGHCSLREAINATNTSTGTNTIAFTIPGDGVHTIQPLSALPTITDPVVIDGYTQPGASPNTNGPGLGLNTVLKIELDGSNAGAGAHGFHITSGGSTIKGLAINRFPAVGIRIEGNSANGNLVQGNFIGTNVLGTAARANGDNGVSIFTAASGNTVGGTTPQAGNVISGNNFNGVSIGGGGASANVVQGNFIGTDISGTGDLGNGLTGVRVSFSTSDNTIGGTQAGARNIISGNDQDGVFIFNSGATGNVVLGNFIGTDVTGSLDVGNTLAGVRIDLGASNNTIGGMTAGAGNTIAFNGGDGVFIASGISNAILGNSTFSNAGLGIDLPPNGVTPNDVGDGDAGANNLQNFPVLTSATSGSSTTIEGTLNSTANTAFRLEFFSNTACDPSGNGEGESFLGSTNVTTDGSGNASFMVTFPTEDDDDDDAVAPGQLITSTATDPGNNTSEFSECVAVEEDDQEGEEEDDND